jgi:hypothetical protein
MIFERQCLCRCGRGWATVLHCPAGANRPKAVGAVVLPQLTRLLAASRPVRRQPEAASGRPFRCCPDGKSGASQPLCISPHTTRTCCTLCCFALQLPLDDVVLSHLSQLDLFVESLKQQLAHQSAAAKAAKAEAAAAAAAVAAGCARGSDRRSRHVTPRSHYIQQQQQQAASQGSGVEGGEGQVSTRKQRLLKASSADRFCRGCSVGAPPPAATCSCIIIRTPLGAVEQAVCVAVAGRGQVAPT